VRFSGALNEMADSFLQNGISGRQGYTKLTAFAKILCVACSHRTMVDLQSALSSSSTIVLTAAAPDQAAAICVGESISLAIVDAESIRGKEWSVVKTLKLVRPALPVVLLEERADGSRLELPEGVTGSVAISRPWELPVKVAEFLNNETPKQALAKG
jgi:hypothetical protein